MDSYINDFSTYVVFLKDLIETTTTALQDENEISSDAVEYNIYDNYGDYTEETEKVKLEESETPILVCVRNDGGVVDTSASISTYLQSVSIEIMSPIDKKDVVAKVFNTIALQYSKKITTIADKPTLMLISDLPDYSSSRTDVIAVERFTITLHCDFVIYDSSLLGDQTSIYINDVKLPFKSWTIASTDELEADNKFGYSDNRTKFLFNTNVFVFKIEYFYQSNNSVCKALNSNAFTNGNFGQSYKIKVVYDETTVLETTMTHKQTTVSAAQGSLLLLTSEFYPYSNINTDTESD